MVETPVVVNANNDIEVYKGQGEGDTRWKGWPWNIARVELVIFLKLI